MNNSFQNENEEIFEAFLIDDLIINKIKNFIQHHREKKNKLVFITSGGTSVPLEEKTVRFIDNFSYGTRGSASAEAFIDNSVAVIFMYRKKTLQPYERHISSLKLLDIVKYRDSSHDSFKIDLSSINKNFNKIFDDYTNALENKMLLEIEYSSIFEYLKLLKFICTELNILNENAIIYLSAAVSDFYLPINQMPKHKIQSDHGCLKLDLRPVPKMLGKLKSEWCPRAFVISFKLETDESLLISKSLMALDKYKHNLVVANILETRKNQVIVIDGDNKNQYLIKLNDKSEVKCFEIEIELIKYILDLHAIYLNNKC